MKLFRIMALPMLIAVVALASVFAPSAVHALNLPGATPLIAMAALSTTMPTLLDMAKAVEPDGKIAKVAELLSQTNELLDDMVWVQGNLPTGHRTTVRTGLPTVAWRLINAGTLPSKSTRAQIDEQCGMLDAWGEVDCALAELNGNTAEWRLSEAMAFIEAMNQEMAQTLFYGNSGTAPEEFTGLSIRYSSLSAANARCIVNGGGSQSDNSSIWLIVWGPNTVHGIVPKGSTAGLSHEDKGKVTTENAAGVTGARMDVYRDHWEWKAGLALRDWRYACRIANIDISNLVAESSNADLIKLMTKATHRVQDLRMGRPAFYVNRTIAEFLDIQRQAQVKSGGGVTWENVDGKNILTFRGIPIRTCDALLETEATVS